MTKKRKISLYIIIFMLLLCSIIAASYAFYSFISDSDSKVAVGVNMPSCVKLTFSNETKISLSGDNALPISDGKALSSANYRYTFSITNDCATAAEVIAVLVPSISSTMPMEALKYALVETTAQTPSQGDYLGEEKLLNNQMKAEILTQTSMQAQKGYELTTITINQNQTKSYYLYLWIDENEGELGDNATMNKTLTASLSLISGEDYVALPATDTITALASETGAGATDGHPGAMVNDEYGVRYIGENPSNFVWFNCSNLDNQNASTCERWRIIGVFDEKYDTTGNNIPDTTGPLIKIIRNDSLGSYLWDYKQNGVGSSISNDGSNDWSDSQLMMMLNPPEFLNTGYVTEEGAATHSNTISGEYVVSNGINIYRNMGSYFDEGLTAYSPAQTTTSGFTSTTEPGATFTRMNSLSQSMIATVKWHLTGPDGTNFQSSSNGLASHFYAYERNNPDGTGYVYTGAGTRPKIWYGKVGLMYPSDYGFATSGDSSVSGYDRTSCLNKELYNWNDGSYQTYCAYKDWLLYAGATGGTSATKGSTSQQWTITPYSSDAYRVFLVSSHGSVFGRSAYGSYAGRPVLYLKAGVSITEGSGTYDSPYKLSQ